MMVLNRGARVYHPQHGAGTVLRNGVCFGTVLVHYDWQKDGFAKVARIAQLKLKA